MYVCVREWHIVGRMIAKPQERIENHRETEA